MPQGSKKKWRQWCDKDLQQSCSKQAKVWVDKEVFHSNVPSKRLSVASAKSSDIFMAITHGELPMIELN